MKKLENLKVVDILREGDKATIVALSEENTVYQTALSKSKFNNETKKFVKDESKAEFVENLCMEIFGVPFDDIESVVTEDIEEAKTVTMYYYDSEDRGGDSPLTLLYEINIVKELKGQPITQELIKKYKGLINGKIVDVNPTEQKLEVAILFDGETEPVIKKYRFYNYVSALKKFFYDESKAVRSIDKINDTFNLDIESHTDFDKMLSIIDTEVTCQFQKAGNNDYVEILEVK